MQEYFTLNFEMMRILNMFLFFGFLFSCEQEQAQGKWIKGSEQEKIETIEKQFRGFDNAMAETGYRYQELYWAGQDENWDYANYQLEKLEAAIINGLQRRPKRKDSASQFLTFAIPEMQKTIDNQNRNKFNSDFQLFTNHCNNCHAMEKVPFITVDIPINGQSQIKAKP